MSRMPGFGSQLAQRFVAPPVPLEDQQTGPLTAAYAQTLSKQRLNGSVTNPMTMNGAAAGSPFNAAITLAKPVQMPTQAQMMFESPADTQARQAAMMFETPTQQSQRQAAEMFANSQPVEQPAPTQTMGDDVAAAAPSQARDVQVIRGTQTSNVHFDEDGNGTETAGAGRQHFTDPDVFQEIGETDQAYNQRKAAETSMSYRRQASGAKNPDVFQGVGETSDFFNKRKLQVQGLAVQKAEGEKAARSQTQAPPSDLKAALAGLTPEQQQQLQTYKKAGATDQQVIARAISLANRKAPAAAKPTSFSAGTQQDRYIITQAQKRIRELDAKVRVDPRQGDWAEPKKLTPAEQTEYDGLKATVAAKSKAVASFDGGQQQATGQDQPATAGAKLTHDEALAYVKQAGGDKAKARELARAAGRSF